MIVLNKYFTINLISEGIVEGHYTVYWLLFTLLAIYKMVLHQLLLHQLQLL